MSYGYGEKDGPHTWALQYPQAGGTRQSPINLDTSNMTYDNNLGSIRIDFSNVQKQILNVKEHNFNVSIDGKATLSGGPLQDVYEFAQFHFHWGSGNNWGSEHMVNGVSCPSELHIVFRNTKYEKSEAALTYCDGLAVVGIFLQAGTIPNDAMKRICALLPTMQKGESKEIQPNMNLNALLPRDMSRYYTYAGSLTTPPCSECVTWIVMDEPVSMSLEQIEILRKMHTNCATCGRTDNFRPVCPIGTRVVRSSFPC